ncbi:polysaccharide pyruvyl transferase family protein [Echinicola rosea]|uniref:Polysaccharide pyruvyl transferase domain-containing protein n=1 Tax=Echinicola rosea TaxID=1807691 RepID=A0ABQ1V1G0_9BACT|nr:polysaccharide pyruvyl transferase family protein [Echinicola rosea]GGF31830.1 hypothetical protein GCM10011339_20050 [Echinicola rosea]
MKVGIITILNVNNYGAELQAYALLAKIRSWGHDVEIINYLFYKHPRHKRTSKSRPFVQLSFQQKLKERLYPIVADIKAIPYWKAKVARDQKFSRFHDRHNRLSREFRSMDELYSFEGFDYDVFVVGSDQVWNPNSGSNIEPYFLTFAPKETRKISYASSFGVDSIPTGYHETYRQFIDGFDDLAVREEAGTQLIREMAKKEVDWVLDPTFLLDRTDWSQIAVSPEIGKQYVLIYALTDAEYITSLAYKIAKERRLAIVRLCKNASREDADKSIINVIDGGPEEFLGLFLNASFVLTTSFHGVCFSLNFKVPFYSVLKREKTNNSRQLNLLAFLGLEERVLYVGDPFPDPVREIDYVSVNEKLEKKIQRSVNYLNSALTNEQLSEVSK